MGKVQVSEPENLVDHMYMTSVSIVIVTNSSVRNIDCLLVNSRFAAAKQFLSVPCALTCKRLHKCDACRDDPDLRLNVEGTWDDDVPDINSIVRNIEWLLVNSRFGARK